MFADLQIAGRDSAIIYTATRLTQRDSAVLGASESRPSLGRRGLGAPTNPADRGHACTSY